MGSIDTYGHAQGWMLARRIPEEVMTIAQRIRALLESGWTEIQVITDHGWLFLPGGLPKAELPEHLTILRKGRCARLKTNAETDLPIVPWRWDENVRIAIAPGISCFTAGKEYEHGGISLQECVTPVLIIRGAASATPTPEIESVRWTGLRCKIQVYGAVPGTLIDIRSKPADPASTVAATSKPVNAEGQASLAIPDDSLEGQAATVVLFSGEGNVIAQMLTLIGSD